VPRDAGLSRRLSVHFDVQGWFARGEDALERWFEMRRQLGQDLPDGPPDMLGHGTPIHMREGFVELHVAEVLIEDGEPRRRRREKGVELCFAWGGSQDGLGVRVLVTGC